MKPKFNKDGLVPAIAQDVVTGEVLMLAYMNAASYKKTLSSGYACYYSRSRKKLWKKGETSGNVQRVCEVLLDCDADTVLLRVEQEGPACHTNRKNCFFRKADKKGNTKIQAKRSPELGAVLSALSGTIRSRLKKKPEGSYTVKLTRPDKKKQKSGLDKVLEKIGEESTEVILAAKGKSDKRIVSEVDDLLYHLIVLLELKGIPLDKLAEELLKRSK